MTRALFLLAMLVPLIAADGVRAITRDEDIIRDLNETFKAPSAFPPNPALRPGQENGGRDDDDRPARTLSPVGPDIGPDPSTVPQSAPIRAYPFMVALIESGRPRGRDFVCAGTLIAPHWVLTAAHCTFNWVRRWPTDSEVSALFDTTLLREPGTRYRVTKIIPHPDYDPRSLKADLALVRIDTQGKSPGTPLQLEGPAPSEQVGEIGHIVGWGVTNLEQLQQERGGTLQLIQVAVRGGACFSAGNFPKLLADGGFCASSLFRHHDVCFRFGGGPLFLRDAKGTRYLAGLVSWSVACPPEVDKMNAYLDVQKFVPWIKGVIAGNGGPGQ